ncbi:anti-sigma factor [Agromyces seonyuensis]|uniref:Regulator of SigK n=1 Tax=Agromyces seonyuensis TaxID=2662446 RepID=A0A6I4NZ82_9MICO|nr:anti-sigma factor [Agromyces seonyuensis]MWB99471.1 hypothetical protein [Agromyces seonyuensis]
MTDDPNERPADESADRLRAEAEAAAAADALGALDADDRAAYLEALAASPEAQADSAAFGETAARLGAAVPPIDPPSALKDAIFARLDDVPQLAPEPAPVVPTAVPAAVPHDETPRAPASEPGAVPDYAVPGPAELRARRRWSPVAVIAAVAAVFVLIAGGVALGAAWTGPNGWNAQRQLQAILDAEDAQTATTTATDGGELELVWSEEDGSAAVRVESLPAPAEGSTYELWFIGGDGARSAGTFEPASDGSAWRVLEGEMSAGDVVGVTVEPDGGSVQPTTDPIAVLPS